jgi:hypothetical protein
MSQKNGDKSRYQINRKRAVLRRAKMRALAAGQVAVADRAAPVKEPSRKA